MPIDYSKCEGCPIDNWYDAVECKGPENAPFMVVTDVVSKACAEKNIVMTEKQMKFFSQKMMDQEFSKEDFRFVPACRCPYDPNDHTTKEKTKIHKHCRVHFLDEVAKTNPEVVIPLGATAVSQAFGKPTKITKVRGMSQRIEDIDKPAFPLFAPSMVVTRPENEPLFDADLRSFVRYFDANYDATQASAIASNDYERIYDLQFLIDEDAELVSFDLETTGLRWYQQGCDVRNYQEARDAGNPEFRPRAQILTMQFSTGPGNGYMLVWDHPEDPIPEADKPRLRNQIRQLLCKEDRIVVGQNLKIDNVFLWMLEGIRFRIGGDTLMLATILDENMPEKNLDILTKIFVPELAGYADEFNASVDKSRMWEVKLDKMLGYGCGDTDAALRVYNVLEPKVMEDDRLWNHYCRVSIPGLNAFASMETEGMFTDDVVALPAFKDIMQTEVGEQRTNLMRQIHKDLKREVAHDYLGKPANKRKTIEDALSLTRSDFLKEVLFLHPKGLKLTPKVFTKTTDRLNDKSKREPSTSSKDHLPYFFDDYPFVQELAAYIKDYNLLTKSVISFEQKYIVGGKVRPIYSLTKTVTGRSSSEDPNGQNYPKRGERALAYRKMFVAPEGYYVCELDLSQAELRIAGSMAGDKEMIRIYREKGDIHTETAAIVLGITMVQFKALPKKEQKEARSKAKAVNFGFLYGMGWRKFIGFAKTQYGVTFTEEEAQRVRANFFRKYRYLPKWHDAMRAFAKKHKYVRSYSGRIRHLPSIDSPEDFIAQEASRQAINSPVQEFGSTLGVIALGRMNEELNSEFIKIVGFIHDAIVFYVKKEYLDWGMRTVKSYMQGAPLKEWFNVTLPVPIVADCGFGYNLGEIHECDGFSLEEPFDYTSMKDDDGNPVIDVPEQLIPPNDGYATRSVYSLPTDVEPLTPCANPRSLRVARSRPGSAPAKRVARTRPTPDAPAAHRTVRSRPADAAPVVRRTTRTK